MQIFLREYGTSGTVDFSLFDSTATNIITSAVFTSGCCIISQDEGTSANSVNLPVVRNNSFSFNYTATELTSKRTFIKLVDPQWLAHSFCIESYGTSGSQHVKIASGLLQSTIDGNPLQQLFTELQAYVNGWINKAGDQYSYLLRDNSIAAFSTSAGLNQRIRL